MTSPFGGVITQWRCLAYLPRGADGLQSVRGELIVSDSS
jgi:hypothetical protein